MSFQEKADSWRTRAQSSGVKLPVLVGLTALTAMVLVGAGSMLFQAATSDGFSLAYDEERQFASSEGGDTAQEEGLSTVFVYVSGAVATPGVFELPSGSRVCDAIDAAGGFVEGAAREVLNLARVVSDGEQLSVPDQMSAGTTPGDADVSGGEALPGASSKVNINTATAEELDILPGVGLSTAQKIVADRKANGPFSSPEELKRVSGIGDKKYAALADEICVG